MDSKGGEVAPIVPRKDIAESVAYLSAIAPIAKTGDPSGIRDLLRDDSRSDLRDAGDLSDKDFQLYNSWIGPSTTPIVVVLATLELEKDLGVSRFRKLAKRLRDASNQNLVPDDGWPLADIVPEVKAIAAVKRAKSVLEDLMKEPTPEGMHNTPIRNRIRN